MSDLITRVHGATMRLPLHVLVQLLNKNLGTTLVAYMANVRSRQLPNKWALDPEDPNHVDPHDDVKKRLQLAYQAFRAIDDSESEHVARQWLIGANPRFDGQTPAERIRELDSLAVFGALGSFLEDGGSGGA